MTRPYGVKPAAAEAWDDLQHALRDVRTPCMGPNAAWWTSDSGDERHAAALNCQQCPALTKCAQYAKANKERDGFVWGGKTR